MSRYLSAEEPVHTSLEAAALKLAELAIRSSSDEIKVILDNAAKIVREFTGIQGILLLVLDEDGDVLILGSENLALLPGPSLSLIKKKVSSQNQGEMWVSIEPEIVEPEDVSLLMARTIDAGDRPLAVLVVSASHKEQFALLSKLQLIDRFAGHLTWLITSLLRLRELDCLSQLQEIIRIKLTNSEPNQRTLQTVMTSLATTLRADVATLLLREQNEVRLSASTDLRLGEDQPVVYLPGQGLTGQVFLTGRSFRIRNTNDSQEVARIAGIKRNKPLHPERSIEGHYTVQFLGVPIRNNKKVTGVLRMSRKENTVLFSCSDERALQTFADFLGATLARFWELLLYKSIMESDSEAICVSRREIDSGGRKISRIVLANSGAERLFQRTPDDLIGIDVKDLYANGDYETIRKRLRADLRRDVSDHRTMTSRVKTANGDVRLVEISHRLLANSLLSPPPYYTIGVMRDTTEAQLRDTQHRHLLDMLAEKGIAYYRADLEGITVESTLAESNLTGYPQNEIVDKLPREQLYVDEHDRCLLLDRLRRQDGGLLQTIQHLKRKDNTRFWAEGEVRLVKDIEGKEVGVEGLYRDVTDQIRLQGFLEADTTKLMKSQELLQRLEDNVTLHLDHMASLSHQIQTPLGALAETVRNILEKVLDPKCDQEKIEGRLRYVLGQITICSLLVRNLAYMDLMLRGERFMPARLDFARLASEIGGDFSHLLAKKEIRLIIDGVSLRRHIDILGHRELLKQVLVNLIDNAIKYSVSHSTIMIRGYHWPRGRVVEVANRGLPIPSEYRERVFERGFRTNKAKMMIPDGTGLGLWLVRKIVEAHSSEIRCGEIVEEGKNLTVFRIIFPHPRVAVGRRVR